jgi:hypothetical protein
MEDGLIDTLPYKPKKSETLSDFAFSTCSDLILNYSAASAFASSAAGALTGAATVSAFNSSHELLNVRKLPYFKLSICLGIVSDITLIQMHVFNYIQMKVL